MYLTSVKPPYNMLQWETWMQRVTGSWGRAAENWRNVKAPLSPLDGLMGPIFWWVEGHVYSVVRCCLIRRRRHFFCFLTGGLCFSWTKAFAKSFITVFTLNRQYKSCLVVHCFWKLNMWRFLYNVQLCRSCCCLTCHYILWRIEENIST